MRAECDNDDRVSIIKISLNEIYGDNIDDNDR